MRRFVSLGVALALLAALFPGCAGTGQTVQETPRTAIGAVGGAVGGAVIGGAIGGGRGAVAGSLIGALTGGLIGYHFDQQEKDRIQTAREYGYAPSQGTRLKIEAVRANPATLDPGETVNINVTYAVLTPRAEEQVLVRETREVLAGGASVGRASIEITREGGTWRSTVPITLPPNAPPGNYRVIASVETRAGGKDVSETTFRVRP